MAGEEVEQGAAQGVDVGTLVEILAARLLGGDVVRRAHDHAPCGQAFVGGVGFRQAEVRDLQDPVAGDAQICGLDVAVDDASVRRLAEPGGGFRADQRDHGAWQRAALLKQFLRIAAFEQLHRVVGARRVAGLSGLEDRDEVGMGQAGQGARLAQKPLGDGGVVDLACAQDLDGGAPVQGIVGGQIDLAHRPNAELLLDPVAPHAGPGSQEGNGLVPAFGTRGSRALIRRWHN
jgi:hypothetical protein